MVLAIVICLVAALPIKAVFEITGLPSRALPAFFSVVAGTVFFYFTGPHAAKQEASQAASREDKEPLGRDEDFSISPVEKKHTQQSETVSSAEEDLEEPDPMDKRDAGGLPPARIVGGIASTQTDLIQSKECPKCAEEIKRRARLCKHCGYEYPEDDYVKEQAAFAKFEDDMRQKKEQATEERRQQEAEERRKREEEERRLREAGLHPQPYRGLVIQMRLDGKYEVKDDSGALVVGARAYNSIADARNFIDLESWLGKSVR